MYKKTRLACAIALPLLICGCQSYSTPRIQPVAATCPQPPAPAAWFMEERAPNLTQRMLNELSASPTQATKD
ncbi:lysis system o-spanin lipoprotein Rz1 [Pseudomonas sp. PCH446]